MRALSIRQPWAELILEGRKRYELRSWRGPSGERILIHAAMRVDGASAILAGLQPEALNAGALVGSVEVVDCVPFTPEIANEMRDAKAYFGDWQAGLFAWELRDPIRLTTSIPLKGRLGLFAVPDSVMPTVNVRRSHFVQYHNSEKMGYGCDQISDFQIVTRKPLQWLQESVLGSVVWLIVGEGRPRRFSVCLMFQADQLGPAPTTGFEYVVRGRHGRRFAALRIDEEPWFAEFRASQGNFAFGLSEIAPQFVPHFENLLEDDGRPILHRA